MKFWIITDSNRLAVKKFLIVAFKETKFLFDCGKVKIKNFTQSKGDFFMRKIFSLLMIFVLVFIYSICCASISKTGVLIVAPLEYKTQDFLEIATKEFGKEYEISQGLQDDWATYCWDKGFTVSDPKVSRETLSDFSKTTRFNKIIFIIFKNSNVQIEDLGSTVNFSIFGVNRRDHIRRRANIESRIVIMDNEGKTLKVFEEAYTDASMASELRANRGAFEGLCKNIAGRLKENTK